MVKSGDIRLKTFGNDLLRNMSEPVGYLPVNMTIRGTSGIQKTNLLGRWNPR